MRILPFLFLSAAIAVSPVLTGTDALARPGSGHSFGSRGSRTYSAPRLTPTAPRYVQPMSRSMTPNNYSARSTPFSGTGRYGYARRHPFATGFMGGLLGAGLFGLLSGHGFFWGFHGGSSLIGFLFQAALIGMLIMWFLRRRHGPSSSRRGVYPMNASTAPATITPDDYRAFERLLIDIQAAWSTQNLRALSSMATPEMVSYFNEQLSDYASRGAKNVTSNVRFQRGDLSEAWREGNLTYATVAMQYSLIDVTTDVMGHVIDGSSTEPVVITELWTFVRSDGRGNWMLSAIQQAS